MNYSDLPVLIALSFLVPAVIDLSKKAGISIEQGRKKRATVLIFAAGVLQLATVFLSIKVGFRLFSV